MNWLCKLFGHRWKCWMAYDSYCRWCGITYTEYTKDKQTEGAKK